MKQIVRPFDWIGKGLAALRQGAGPGLAISQHLAPARATTVLARRERSKGSRLITLPMRGKA